LNDLRDQSFPSYTIQDWKQKAEQLLKGKTVESLQSNTYEKIILKSLYTKEDEHCVPDYPGGPDYRRGIFPLGYRTNEWKIAQKISYETSEELALKLKDTFKKGQTAISFELTNHTVDNLLQLIAQIPQNLPFAINSKWLQVELFNKLEAECGKGNTLTGYIASDPISLFAKEGIIAEEYVPIWIRSVHKANNLFPKLRTVLVDTSPYHNGGANAVQELGIAAAEGVFLLQELIESGMNLDTALEKMVFQFSIGSNFFMEIAKLRAARILWNRITGLYGAKDDNRGMQITACTSTFTKTIYDPHVNLLRSANEAFAAVLGNVQYLHVDSFDTLTGSTSFSERISRNVQLILKEEAHLNKVIDPAGGSWYVEALTHQLAEASWKFFQEIEASGGILKSLTSNWLQKEIARVYEERNMDVQTRKQSIIGTNVYAKLDETVSLQAQQNPERPLADSHFSIEKITAVPQYRLAEPFEQLRLRAKQIELKTGSTPSVGMLCLGDLKQFKARLDFMKGFIHAGGIQEMESEPIYSLEQAKNYLLNLPAKFVCICGTNEKYESIGHEIISVLQPEFRDYTFFLAGLPDKEDQSQWLEEGIQQFIHASSNCYETLHRILSDMEVTLDEKQKA